jgi:hypothetical protein
VEAVRQRETGYPQLLAAVTADVSTLLTRLLDGGNPPSSGDVLFDRR